MLSIQEEISSDAFLVNLLVERGLLTDRDAYAVLSTKTGVPTSIVKCSQLQLAVTRTFPLHMADRFKVLPFRVEDGKVHVAGTRVPKPEFFAAAARFTSLLLEFHLVSARNFRELSERANGHTGELIALGDRIDR
jgi:hypothetical protein